MSPRSGTIRRDSRGRARIWLGRASSPVDGWREVVVRTSRGPRLFWVHPLATSGGWQWLSRYLVMAERGWLPRSEHVHHRDHDRSNDRPQNLRVIPASVHGAHHAALQRRGHDGRFLAEVRP